MAVMKFAVGLAAGYVLGSRAGREKYEQIVSAARTTQQKFNGQSAPKPSVAAPVGAEPVVGEPLDAESSPVAGSPVPRPPRRRTKSTVTAPAVTADPLA